MRRRAALTSLLALALVVPAGPALADHTNPGSPVSPVIPQPGQPALTAGEGEWKHIANVGPMQGTDLEFFTRGGVTYVAGGTLGQGPTIAPGFVGQRVVQLTDAAGAVLEKPKVVADHGSARCNAPATSATGLQHDVQAVPLVDTQLLVDTTDATGRCHDTAGGGLELIDVSGLGTEGFEAREIGLIRFNGLSHTVTADRDRPGILYNNGADFPSGPPGQPPVGLPWTDVVDVRSCMNFPAGTTLEAKRAACKPVVHRIAYDPAWTSKTVGENQLAEPASCHDITYANSRLHCAALNATLIVDVSQMFAADGSVKGTPLPCATERVPGTSTGALVTDCALRPAGATGNPSNPESVKAYEDAGRPVATGWRFLGTVNHPGRACPSPAVTTCNTNLTVLSTDGVAVSHESDPTPDGKYMLVTDERGGGVLPPGATCAPGLDNPIGNGGLHVFDTSDPASIKPAMTPEGEEAVYIGKSPTPSPTFCTIHVIEQIPGEQRIIAAYYDGGTKIVDYFIDPQGRWTFKETAAYRLPGANTWASEVFKIEDNRDGTNTYYFASNSFSLGQGTARGLDVFSWTGPANAVGTQAPAAPAPGQQPGSAAPSSAPSAGATTPPQAAPATATRRLPATGADAGLLLLAALLLPAAFAARVLRRRLDGSS